MSTNKSVSRKAVKTGRSRGKTEVKSKKKTKAKVKAKTKVKVKAKVKAKTTTKAKTRVKTKVKAKTTAKVNVKTTTKAKTKVKAKTTAKTKTPTKAKTTTKAKTRVKTKVKAKTTARAKTETPTKPTAQTAIRKKKTKERSIRSAGKGIIKKIPDKEEIIRKEEPLKIFLPGETREEISYETPTFTLPEEYGDNEVLLMPVDPHTIFVTWEIKKESVEDETGKITLRIYDVTDLDFDGSSCHHYTDVVLNKRIGSEFFAVTMHGRDVLVEVGILGSDNTFVSVVRSNRISVPFLLTSDELGIAEKLSETGIPFGY
ncbi:MAG: DUF4912 domain-containing protein [Nitrospiraceae bacterium]|nr:MAG: DUF4912 domain-containing protein [Nitrospiraceae bacterium]